MAAVRRGLEQEESSAEGLVIQGLALLQLNRPGEAERSVRDVLYRYPNCALAYLVLADAVGLRREYQAQLQAMDAYLRLEPNGAIGDRVRRAREALLPILAKPHGEN